MLQNLARSCVRHRRRVLVVWLLVVVAAVAASSQWGGSFAQGGRLPGADSDQAYQLLSASSPSDPNVAGDTAQVVFQDPHGIADAAAGARIDAFLATLHSTPGIITAPATRADLLVSKDGTVATGEFATRKHDDAVIASVTAATERMDAGPTKVALGGWRFQQGGVPSSEGIGLLVAAVILLVAFGSVVAMGLPIVTAIAGIVVGLASVQLWAAAVQTPDFTVQVASMIGIGVGIDYALFIVTRYRQALGRTGGQVEAAVMEALSTAGRAVLFAGVTVVISLLGMLLMGMRFLDGLAFGTASAVLVAVVAAITLLPALLGVVGTRIDRLSVHRRRHAVAGGENVWHRWSRFVQRHAVASVITGTVLLGALAAPAIAMRFASADAGNDPVGSTTRVAYDRLAQGFGPGFNGPLLVVQQHRPGDLSTDALSTDVAKVAGVAAVGAVTTNPAGDVSVITVIPTTGPQAQATTDLVHRLRAAIGHLGVAAHVGGQTASDVDFSERMASRLPVFIGSVLALSFVLLMLVFRSLLVPLKAVLLNLLSIGAAYGAMVIVFQWWGGAPIEPWAPMMLFAIVFGLSMDYEVFLLASMKERVDAGDTNSVAVVEGLASTARLITAAAAIMVCVFGSFMLGDLRSIRLIGFGLATAVFLDATVVRMLLVPATMELLGERNWWLPRPLHRAVPAMSPTAVGEAS